MPHISDKPTPQRKYTQGDRDRFFLEFDRLGSTTAAARILGFKAATCAQWVWKAGLHSTHRETHRPDSYVIYRRLAPKLRK